MVDITPLISSDRQVIQSYGPSRFRISGRDYSGPVFVYPDRTEEWNAASHGKLLQPDDFSAAFPAAANLDVLLFGCGARMEFYPPSFRAALKEKGLLVEIMDTGAACRTYNVLMAEGRRVAAALLPV